MDNAHEAMTAEQRQQLSGYVGDPAQTVAELRQGAAAFVADLDAAHQAMTAEQRQQLKEKRAHLASKTEALLEEMDHAHQTMTAEQQQQLDLYVDGLRQAVAQLRREAATFVADLDAAHQTLAVEQSRYLDAERTQLASDVAAMRAELRARRDELRATQREARRIWTSFATIIRARRARKPAPAMPPPLPIQPAISPSPPPTQPGQETPTAIEMAADDLTAIRGIGPGMQKRLNDAGIWNFAQLGTSTPEALREALGEAVARLAKVEEWIAQARESE